MRLIRGHWGGVEIRNHWRKDACLFEDKTRSRNPNIVATLAMMRNVLLFFFSNQDIHSNLPGFVEAITADPDKSYSMIKAELWVIWKDRALLYVKYFINYKPRAKLFVLRTNATIFVLFLRQKTDVKLVLWADGRVSPRPFWLEFFQKKS